MKLRYAVEGHRFKFFVITNTQGKRILFESVEVVGKEGSTHTPEFFSGSARAFAIVVVIEFIRVGGAIQEKKDRVERCGQRNPCGR
jgi:hypothetical protein